MKLAVAVVILLAAVTMCQAGKRQLSLDECVELALENSAAARNAALDESIAESKVAQARSLALPQLKARATYTRLDELQEVEFGDETLEVGTIDNYLVEGEVGQVLFSAGKVRAALRAAGLSRNYAASVRSESESGIRKGTVILFNSILLAEKTVAVVEESLALLKELVDQTERRMNEGKAAEFDLLTATVRYENEKPQLISARNDLALLMEEMRRLLNLGEEDFDLSGELKYEQLDLGEEPLVKAALQERALLKAVEELSRLKREDVISTRADMLPTLSAYALYSGANSYGFVTYGDEEWEWHWNAGLALSWNIWDGGLTRGVLHEKRLEYQKSLVALDDTEREVKLAVKSAFLKIKYAAEAVASASKNVQLAEKAMELAGARHGIGMSTYLDYTDANVALKRARLAYLASVAAYSNAQADLAHAIGGQDVLDKLIKETAGESDE